MMTLNLLIKDQNASFYDNIEKHNNDSKLNRSDTIEYQEIVLVFRDSNPTFCSKKFLEEIDICDA